MKPDLERSSDVRYWPCGCWCRVLIEDGSVEKLELRVCSECFDQQLENMDSPMFDIDGTTQLTLPLPSRDGRPAYE